MSFPFTVPTPQGPISITLEPGSSAVFVGANGGGKTRLAVKIETDAGSRAHRIAAHRALILKPDVAKISEVQALQGLRTGQHQHNFPRLDQRWSKNAAVSLLNDFDYLIQSLFADQANTSLATHKSARLGTLTEAKQTKLEILTSIWERLLPHREIHMSGDDIMISVRGSLNKYKASELSDGERSIFYLIGQVLVAEENSLLIFDEPELHIHRSIMGKLWDELEAVRSDCAFVLITHDLEFAASRVGQKFVIRDYTPDNGWALEPIPEDTGFSEEITTLILGSRKPILFIEGTSSSLDRMIYRACYPEWTVISRNSCEQVIHSVVTMRANQSLTRVTCSGIVDADAYDAVDAAYFAHLGVAILPVSEIENLILLPDVSRAIAQSEGYTGTDLNNRLSALKQAVFAKINQPGAIDAVVTRHCRRRIDRALKKVDLSSATTVADIAVEYEQKTAALDVAAIGAAASGRIQEAVQGDNLPAFLAAYDDKGLMAVAAAHLKSMQLKSFDAWLSRVLRNDTVPALTTAIRGHLPPIQAQ